MINGQGHLAYLEFIAKWAAKMVYLFIVVACFVSDYFFKILLCCIQHSGSGFV